jgi:Uma2 family endonuclease
MMTEREDFPHFTPLEYLEWEDRQETRHEFVDGVIRPLPGENGDCERIALNFYTMLQDRLQCTICRVFDANVKVQTLESTSFLYPAASVSGDVHDRSANKFITHPCLIIEVLSPSTEVYDRGEKFELYRRVPSLEEYVLVRTDRIGLDLYQRNQHGDWKFKSYESGAVIELKSVNLTLEIDLIYTDPIEAS